GHAHSLCPARALAVRPAGAGPRVCPPRAAAAYPAAGRYPGGRRLALSPDQRTALERPTRPAQALAAPAARTDRRGVAGNPGCAAGAGQRVLGPVPGCGVLATETAVRLQLGRRRQAAQVPRHPVAWAQDPRELRRAAVAAPAHRDRKSTRL